MERMSRFKKPFVLICIIGIVIAVTGYSVKQYPEAQGKPADIRKASAEDVKVPVPDLGRVQSICELATLECYYHNVAKSTKEPGQGLFHFGEKERPFWIEYTGIAEISYQSDLIKMEQNGNEIIITLPRPKVTCTVEPDSWNEESYVISKDRWFQKNPITADDQTRAIEKAQADMKEEVEKNPALLNTARMQAKELIANYIRQIGRMAGVEYRISWKDADASAFEPSEHVKRM